MVSTNSLVKRIPEVVFSNLDGETVMMNTNMSAYLGIDSIGGRIWEIIEKPIKVSDLCDLLCQEYDVKVEQCTSDVLPFLREMVQGELVTIVTKSTE